MSLQFWQLDERTVLVESLEAGRDRINNFRCPQIVQSIGMRGDVLEGPSHHRAASDEIAGRVVMEGNGELRQALEKLLLGFGRDTPGVLKHLVSVEEVPLIKELDSALNFA